MLLPVILSGGVGSRLWPLSRGAFPKQFNSLLGEESLFQSTLQRVADIADIGKPIVICNEEHRFIVAEQLQQINIAPEAIILEPMGRNTAPAAAIAALYARAQDQDPVLLILPSDHAIVDLNKFQLAVTNAIKYAKNGSLVTFGVLPDRPETGYGYIKYANKLQDDGVYQITQFVEKPNLELANTYINSGNYFWNSGIFMFKASAFLAELEQHAPAIFSQCEQVIANLENDRDFLRIDPKLFAACPSDSIDYALMEHVKNGVVVALNAGWSDLGSWTSLWEHKPVDADGNVKIGNVFVEDVQDSYLHSNHRLISAVGVKDHVVVETRDAILVAHKDACQDVKAIVDQLQRAECVESKQHTRVYLPWGSREIIEQGANFSVMRIHIKPEMSVPMHLHANVSEHWVVVTGSASVTKGDEVIHLAAAQSIDILPDEQHGVENTGKDLLEFMVVKIEIK